MSEPSLDDWRAKAARDLGRALESIVWRTDDGFEHAPLCTRDDLASLPHLTALAHLGSRHGTAIHDLVTDPEPSAAATATRRALEHGAEELELCLDALAQDGLEPEPWSEAEDETDELTGWTAPGDGGIAIHHRGDFDRAIAGLDLATTSLWFAAGEAAVPVLGWWLDAAERAGVDVARLRGGVDFDPHARLTLRRIALRDDTRAVARRCEPVVVWDEAAGIVRFTRARCAGVRPLVVDGQVYHLAGGTPAVEVGATLAGLVEIARELEQRGVDFADLAAASTVRVQVGHEILVEIAKLRALRLLWHKVAAACGTRDATPHILAVTSGRQRAEEFDQRTNLVRTTLAAFAATTGGADALLVMPFDDSASAMGARDLAREQQLLLREEGHLLRVADPAAGSAAVEVLTDAIGRQAWTFLQQTEASGGLFATMRDGSLADRLRAQESLREADVRTRRRVLVGINRFADLALGGPAVGSGDRDPEPAVEAFVRFRDTRDDGAAAACVAAVRAADPVGRATAAAGPGHAHASLAELATAAWPSAGRDVEHRFVPVATTDGHEFEDLRASALAAEATDDPDPEVLLLPLGPVRSARARAEFARDLFEVGGFHVIDPGHFATCDDALARLDAQRPAVAVLCGDDAEYGELVPAVRARIGRDGPVFVVAGRVPDVVAKEVDHVVRAGLDAARFLDRLQRDLGVRDGVNRSD